MERMALDSELRERIAAALYEQDGRHGHRWKTGAKVYKDQWRRIADTALAALGLDDLDAFAERFVTAAHPSWPAYGYARDLECATVKKSLEAAFTATDSPEPAYDEPEPADNAGWMASIRDESTAPGSENSDG